MGILGWVILGLIVGSVAKAILPGDYPGGLVIATLIGMAGAMLGGFLARCCSTKTRWTISSTSAPG
jgi:uncharacterized membrane protein YeaQ/YmgE (transglycosylase-associated protein family)